MTERILWTPIARVFVAVVFAVGRLADPWLCRFANQADFEGEK